MIGFLQRDIRALQLLFVYFILQLAGNTFSAENEKYYQLKELWTRSFDHVTTIDVNLDGIDELYLQHGKHQFDVIDYELNNFSQSFAFSEIEKYNVVPITPIQENEIYFLASYSTPDSFVCKILPPTPLTVGKSIDARFLKPFYSIYRNEKSSPDVFHQSFGFLSHLKSGSNRNLSLFGFNTSWDSLGQRGLLLADIKNQQIKWKINLASVIHNKLIEDIDFDGESEIIIGCYANNNGLKEKNSADDSSYVYVFEADGQLKWKRTIGPYWTGAWIGVGDFWGDGNKNIVVYQYSKRNLTQNQDIILILNSKDGSVLAGPKRAGNQFVQSNNYSFNNCYDFNQDGKDEVVVGNTDGIVRMFDGNLTEILSSENFKKQIIVELIEDLDRNGTAEIICTIPNEQIIILDNKLKELCNWQLPKAVTPQVLPVRTKRKINLLLCLSLKDYKEQRLFELQSSTIPFKTISAARKSLGWVAFIVFLITVILFSFASHFRNKSHQLLASLLSHDFLSSRALLISNKKIIEKAGALWLSTFDLASNELLGKKWNLIFEKSRFKSLNFDLSKILDKKADSISFRYHTEKNNAELSLRIISLFLPYARKYFLLLFDLTDEDHFRQLKQWALVAQRLAHSIKNPLTTVKLNAEELRYYLKEKVAPDQTGYLEFIDAIIGQVNKLKKMSDGFMRFLEFEKLILKPVDLNIEIKNLIFQWQQEFSTAITIEFDFEKKLPRVMLDKEQFAFALHNVFLNAVESITGKGKILISTRKVQLIPQQNGNIAASNYVELQLRDTGCGIPAEFLDKVCQPYFTRNKAEGTGLGLSIVQKIVEAHNGRFDIQSEVNFGTTVTFWFKV